MICILHGCQTTLWPVLYRMKEGVANEQFIHLTGDTG